MTPFAAAQTKIDKIARTVKPITADSNGDLPTRIELMKAGNWSDSVKGKLKITANDLQEYADHFKAGLAQAGEGIGLPIDFSHEDFAKAAGWIRNVEVDGDTLYAHVEWSTAGEAALKGGEYKCISPSFYPAGRGGWEDPEDLNHVEQNVLVGAGLTNIPFFKGLNPIMASTSSSEKNEGDKNVIFISADERKSMPTLEEVRVKKVSELTDEEKQVIVDNKDQLTAEEKVSFGLETAPAAAPVVESPAAPVVEPELAEVAASIKSGKNIVMAAADVKAMNDKIDAATKQINAYREKEVQASVTEHVARGAIKADQTDKWVKRIMADETLKEDLAALPSNKILADEIGSNEKAGDATTALAEITDKANAIVTASQGKTSFTEAFKTVTDTNPELTQRYVAERSN